MIEKNTAKLWDGVPIERPLTASQRRRYSRLPRRERGTSLDAYYSYALVVWAPKNRSSLQ